MKLALMAARPSMEFDADVGDLVGRIVAGDSAAGGELVSRYSKAVAALIERRLSGRNDAEDAFQQTFAVVMQKIRRGELQDTARLSGFVCGIARNVALEYARIPARQRTEELSAEPPARGPGPLDQLLREENAAVVRRVLESLSPRDQEVLRSLYLADEPKSSICERLGLGSIQFDQVVFHARQRYGKLYRAAAAKKGWKIPL